jgi:CTP:molybdopterin cytidylyltransferase MocA
MGRPKALLPAGPGGETFVERILRTLNTAGVDEIVVVVGADADAIRNKVPQGDGVRIVDNPDYDRGQLSSLLAGLGAIDRSRTEAVLVTLVDVPLVTADTVRTLLDAYRRRPAPIVRPVSNGRHGHPVIFDRSLFAELERADPSTGAKPVVRAHAAAMLEVPVEDEGAFADVDTPDEYARLIGPLT